MYAKPHRGKVPVRTILYGTKIVVHVFTNSSSLVNRVIGHRDVMRQNYKRHDLVESPLITKSWSQRGEVGKPESLTGAWPGAYHKIL